MANLNAPTVDTIDWARWTPVDRAVIVFVRADSEVLLIRKKRGLGQGKINGPGGRLEDGESYVRAAVRETEEEVGITPAGLTRAADLSFVFTDGYSLYVEVFVAAAYGGTLIETDEADPFWCATDDIPYPQMWEDDALWLPHVLDGAYVSGRFVFEGDTMRSQTLTVLPLPPAANTASTNR